MNEQPQAKQPKYTPERRVWVWQFVVRCIDKADQDERKADAYKLVNQQLRDASDAGGRP